MLTGPSPAQIGEAVASGVLSIQEVERVIAEAKANAENEPLQSVLQTANCPASFISRLRVKEATIVEKATGVWPGAIEKVVHSYYITTLYGETKNLVITAGKLSLDDSGGMNVNVTPVFNLVAIEYGAARAGVAVKIHKAQFSEYETCGHNICEITHGGTKRQLRRALDDLDLKGESGLTEVGLLKLLVRDETAKKILEEPHYLQNDEYGATIGVPTDRWYSVFDVVEQEIDAYTSSPL